MILSPLSRLCSKASSRQLGEPRAPVSGTGSFWRLLNANGVYVRRSKHGTVLSAACASRKACPSCPAGGGTQRTASLVRHPAAASRQCSGTRPYDSQGAEPQEINAMCWPSRTRHRAAQCAVCGPLSWLAWDKPETLGCCPLLGYSRKQNFQQRSFSLIITWVEKKGWKRPARSCRVLRPPCSAWNVYITGQQHTPEAAAYQSQAMVVHPKASCIYLCRVTAIAHLSRKWLVVAVWRLCVSSSTRPPPPPPPLPNDRVQSARSPSNPSHRFPSISGTTTQGRLQYHRQRCLPKLFPTS